MMKQGERSRKKRRGTGMKELKIYAFADEASPEIDGQIRAMERNGLSGLEIRGVDGVNIADISDAKAEEVRKKLDDAGLSVWSIGSPIGKIDVKTGDFRTHLPPDDGDSTHSRSGEYPDVFFLLSGRGRSGDIPE